MRRMKHENGCRCLFIALQLLKKIVAMQVPLRRWWHRWQPGCAAHRTAWQAMSYMQVLWADPALGGGFNNEVTVNQPEMFLCQFQRCQP